MAIIDLRLRAGSLFLAVMLGHILLISAQVSGRSGVPVLEAMTFGVFAEVQRVVWVAVSGTERVWSAYVDLRHVKVERDDFDRFPDRGTRGENRAGVGEPTVEPHFSRV